jgi:hypothetical protein
LPKACRTAAVRKEVADAVIKVKYAKSNRHYTRTKGQIRTICHWRNGSFPFFRLCAPTRTPISLQRT